MDSCRICGCTDISPCLDPWDDEPHACGWIGPGICSACRHTPLAVRAPARDELVPNYVGLTISLTGRLVPVQAL